MKLLPNYFIGKLLAAFHRALITIDQRNNKKKTRTHQQKQQQQK